MILPPILENWTRDDDVLDTWASSWLWAQDVFTSKKDQDYYYPTDLLVTAPDIIFFWVARMIMAGMKFKNAIPFSDVYFTSVIRDLQGRRMSKSLGNSPDPIDVIEEYGADALRFTINFIAPLGQDVLFSTEKTEIGRNFANKIWNAGRFLLMHADGLEIKKEGGEEYSDFTDEWIVSRFQNTLVNLDSALDRFDFNSSSKIIYSYVWNDFCDWYIELLKKRLFSQSPEIKAVVVSRALNLYEEMLKIVHPFMPFITEEIWHSITSRNEGESISISSFPESNEELINSKAENEIEFLQQIVTAIRNIRGEMNIPPSKFVKVYLKTKKLTEEQSSYITFLSKVEELVVDPKLSKPEASASTVIKDCEIYIPLKGLIDLDVERNRIAKELSRIEGALRGVQKKLANSNFINNAPPEVVEKEKQKENDWMISLKKLNEISKDLNS